MDRAAFEAGLRADGFIGPLDRRMGAGEVAAEHTHDFDARVLVLDGDYILTQDGQARHYGPGAFFEVPAGRPHTETFGPTGATYLVGRRAK